MATHLNIYSSDVGQLFIMHAAVFDIWENHSKGALVSLLKRAS